MQPTERPSSIPHLTSRQPRSTAVAHPARPSSLQVSASRPPSIGGESTCMHLQQLHPAPLAPLQSSQRSHPEDPIGPHLQHQYALYRPSSPLHQVHLSISSIGPARIKTASRAAVESKFSACRWRRDARPEWLAMRPLERRGASGPGSVGQSSGTLSAGWWDEACRNHIALMLLSTHFAGFCDECVTNGQKDADVSRRGK